MKTLRARLFIGMTLFILAFGICAGIAAFRSAFEEANELQDALLVQIAALHLPKDSLATAANKSGIDKEDWLIIEELGNGVFPGLPWHSPRSCATRRHVMRLFELWFRLPP